MTLNTRSEAFVTDEVVYPTTWSPLPKDSYKINADVVSLVQVFDVLK